MAVNAWMVPFLNIFGVEKGNCISNFSVRIGSPHDMCELMKENFKILRHER